MNKIITRGILNTGLNRQMVSASQTRSQVTYIRGRNHFIDNYAEGHDWYTFSRYMNQSSAQDPYPYYRKEYLKPKEERLIRAARVRGKKANGAVRGLVDFINFKRDNKYS